jgi:hypothetical protein
MAKDEEGGRKTRRIGKKAYDNLLSHARRTKKTTAELGGEYREAVGRAVENHNLDKRAHGMITKLDRLEPEDLRHTLDDFEFLLDLSGLKARAESVQPMQFDEAAGDEGEAEGEKGEEDVRPRTARQREKDREAGTVQPIRPPTSVPAG